MLSRTLLLFCLLALMTGCGRPPARTAAEDALGHFKSRQAATVTPHGKIRIDTVTEKDGKLRYVTQDGSIWRVSYTKQADGSYQYGTPEEVKE
jgi:hypothetical protein